MIFPRRKSFLTLLFRCSGMGSDFLFQAVGPRYVDNYEGLEERYRVYSVSARRLVDFVGVQETDTVVDICCGTGISSQAVHQKLGEDGSLIGVDISDNMLNRAKEKFSGVPNARFILGDALELQSLIDDQVDVVLANFSLYHFLDDLEELFLGVRDILKPGGMYVFNLTSYFTPLRFNGHSYNRLGHLWLEVADEILKEQGYEGRGDYTTDSSLVDNSDRMTGLLYDQGFDAVILQMSNLPITSEETLDFTWDGFFRFGAATFFSTTLAAIPLPQRLPLIEKMIERAKKNCVECNVQERPNILDFLAIK